MEKAASAAAPISDHRSKGGMGPAHRMAQAILDAEPAAGRAISARQGRTGTSSPSNAAQIPIRLIGFSPAFSRHTAEPDA